MLCISLIAGFLESLWHEIITLFLLKTEYMIFFFDRHGKSVYFISISLICYILRCVHGIPWERHVVGKVQVTCTLGVHN